MRINVQRIRLERYKRGWSQTDLALAAHCSIASISVLERRQRATPKLLKAVADALQVQIEDLIILPQASEIVDVAV